MHTVPVSVQHETRKTSPDRPGSPTSKRHGGVCVGSPDQLGTRDPPCGKLAAQRPMLEREQAIRANPAAGRGLRRQALPSGWPDEVGCTPNPAMITLRSTPSSTPAARGTIFTLRVTATGDESCAGVFGQTVGFFERAPMIGRLRGNFLCDAACVMARRRSVTRSFISSGRLSPVRVDWDKGSAKLFGKPQLNNL